MYSSDVSRRSCWDIHVQYPKLVVFRRWESNKTCYFSIVLRTVLTKYKGFCTRLRTCGKSRSLQGLLESTKKNGGSHAFFRDNYPWISTKMLTSAFFWKRREGYFFTNFLRFRLYIQKIKRIYKDLKATW